MAPPTILRSLPLPTALINPSRIRSYILRLPLFTRGVIIAVLVFFVLELQTVWSVIEWGSLKPSQIGIFTGGMYRLNTFVFVHLGFWHMFFNLLVLVPLMERFEREFGTLTTLALFMGPLAQIPAGIYLVIESQVLRGDTAVVGARYVGPQPLLAILTRLLACGFSCCWQQKPSKRIKQVHSSSGSFFSGESTNANKKLECHRTRYQPGRRHWHWQWSLRCCCQARRFSAIFAAWP
jgi:hypothetical protein